MSWLLLLLAAPLRADTCLAWGPLEHHDLPGQPTLEESSGLAELPSGVLATVEDSGNPPAIHLFTRDGRFLGTSPVRGAENVDWEALAAGPCPGGEGRCLYIGDIGDNKRRRDHVAVHLVPVPSPNQPVTVRATWKLRYPTGPQNAETLLVHPRTGRVLVVTKRKDGWADVFGIPVGAAPGDRILTLEPLGRIEVGAFAAHGSRKVTDGAWDADGDRLVLRTYTDVWLWPEDPCADLPAFDAAPTRLDLGRMVQAEAVAWLADGGLAATSEGAPMPLAILPCARRGAVEATCPAAP